MKGNDNSIIIKGKSQLAFITFFLSKAFQATHSHKRYHIPMSSASTMHPFLYVCHRNSIRNWLFVVIYQCPMVRERCNIPQCN